MKKLHQIALILLASAAPLQFAAASIVTYGFQGSFYSSNIANIAIGTGFSGVLSYDTNAPVLTSGLNYIDYHTGALDLTIGASSLQTNGIVDIELANNVGVGLPTGFFPNRDLLAFSNYVGIATTGPLASDGFFTVILEIVYPLNTLGNLALPGNLQHGFDASYIAIYGANDGIVLGSFASVPEPATIALAAAGIVAMFCRRRSLFR